MRSTPLCHSKCCADSHTLTHTLSHTYTHTHTLVRRALSAWASTLIPLQLSVSLGEKKSPFSFHPSFSRPLCMPASLSLSVSHLSVFQPLSVCFSSSLLSTLCSNEHAVMISASV